MENLTRRIEIGFEGGPVIALRLADEALSELRKALGNSGWHHVTSEDGDIDVDLGKIAFVKTASDSSKVGF